MLNNLIYDRTAADVEAKNAKGLYRHTDMNRVQDAVVYLRNRFMSDGYNPAAYTLEQWSQNDIPKTNRAATYLAAVKSFDGLLKLRESVKLPSSMNALTYIGANNIEKFLTLSDEALDLIESSWWYSDEIFCGEVDM